MEHVKLREKIGYGLGDAASSMFWKLFTMYLLFFYTDVVEISAAVVGTMFLITRIWDTFLDPFIGILGDRTHSRFGKFRPYLLWGAIPFGLCGILTFSSWGGDSEISKIVYAYVTYTLMMMVYSFVNVPYASLLGVMSPDPQARTSLSSYRMTFAFGGSILVLFLIEPLVDIFSKMKIVDGVPSQAFGWQMAAVVFAILAAIMFFLTFSWTKERVKPIKEEKTSLKDDVKDLATNKPWWILLVAGIMVIGFNSLRDGSAVYYFKYYVEASDTFSFTFMSASVTLITIYLVLGQAANILGIMLVPTFTRLMGKKYTFLTATVGATIFSILFYFLPKDGIYGILALQIIISICAGIVSPLLWSMYADISDYSEWKTGRRATGLIFSSSSMSQKLGWTLGGSLTGWLLFYFGFEANTIQSESALTGICLMMSIFPAIATGISALFISRYPLSEKRLSEISSDLENRREIAEQNKI